MSYVLIGTLAGGPGRDEPGEPHPERAHGPFISREAAWAYRDRYEWTRYARLLPLVEVTVAASLP